MAVLIGGLLVLSASLPPEHGHADPLGRAAIVHRHASLHVVHGRSHVSLSGTEALLIRIDNDYLASARPPLVRMGVELAVRAADPALARLAMRVGAPDTAGRIHGPPSRPSSPRPPPDSALL